MINFHPNGFALGGVWESGCVCGWTCKATSGQFAFDLLLRHQRSCSVLVGRRS